MMFLNASMSNLLTDTNAQSHANRFVLSYMFITNLLSFFKKTETRP